MILSITVGYLLAATTGLLVAFLIYRLFKKLKRKTVTAVFWGLFIGGMATTGVIMMNARACIVKGTGDVSFYMVYGSPSYELGNGKTIIIDPPIQNCMIVNDTREDLVLQAVIYGFTSSKVPRDQLVPAGGTLILKSMNIPYLFDQAPPPSITSKHEGAEVSYWLRTRQAYEADFGSEEENADEAGAEPIPEEEIAE